MGCQRAARASDEHDRRVAGPRPPARPLSRRVIGVRVRGYSRGRWSRVASVSCHPTSDLDLVCCEYLIFHLHAAPLRLKLTVTRPAAPARLAFPRARPDGAEVGRGEGRPRHMCDVPDAPHPVRSALHGAPGPRRRDGRTVVLAMRRRAGRLPHTHVGHDTDRRALRYMFTHTYTHLSTTLGSGSPSFAWSARLPRARRDGRDLH